MAPESEARGAIVRGDVLALGGRGEQRRALAPARYGRERELLLAARDLPEREVPVPGKIAQRARIRERLELAALELRRAA